MTVLPAKVIALLLAGLALTAGLAGASAQGSATPAAEASQPANIGFVTAGNCDKPATILFKLEDLTSGAASATPAAMAAPSASPVAGSTLTSTTVVNSSLDDLLADTHSINFRESLQAIDTFTACGEIAGTPANGTLEIALNAQNGSGLSGTARLTDNGDGTTTIVVSLTQGEPSPAATPAG
jgi:hypothetical protein